MPMSVGADLLKPLDVAQSGIENIRKRLGTGHKEMLARYQRRHPAGVLGDDDRARMDRVEDPEPLEVRVLAAMEVEQDLRPLEQIRFPLGDEGG